MGDYAVMQRRTLLTGAATLGLAAPALAQGQVEIQFWHGLSQPLGGLLEQRVAAFNASQPRFKVVPTYRGSYPETMVAAIAGLPRQFRAAHRADVRGRHRHDDGRRPRHQAGA